MRRMLIILLALMLIVSAGYAEGEDDLLRHAVELGRKMDALAEDEAYIASYTTDPTLQMIAGAYGDGDHDDPCEVREVVLDEIMPMLLEYMKDIPDSGKRQMQNLLPNAMMQSYINALGVDMVFINAILHKSVTFAQQDAKGQGVWILYYEDAAPIAVSWYAENGAVHMEAGFLLQNFDLPFETRSIALASPALDGHARSLAAELLKLAGNEQYLTLLGMHETVADTVRAYAANENPIPRLVLCARTDDAQAANALLTQQIGYLGDVYMAAAGAMRANVIFADPDAAGAGLYLFLYEDGTPIIVTWKGENGAYHLSAAFQPGELLASCQNADDVNAWAESIGLNVRFMQP